MFEQAERMKDAPLSGIRKIIDYSGRLEREGKPIVHLEIGEPDFNTPQYIVDAAKKALDENQVHYGPVVGTERVRRAVSRSCAKKYALDYTPEEVQITHGVAHGLFLAMMAYLNPGDEILVPDPGYLCYFTIPNIARAVPVSYHLDPENDYQVDGAELESLVTARTRMILLNTPSNPCGFVLNPASLAAIAGVALRHDLLVVTDEVYADMVYDAPFRSIAELAGMRSRTIVLNGFSKYYAMTGWRIGYLMCDRSLMDPIMRLSFYSISCPNTFVQAAAAEAMEGDDAPCRAMVAEYKKRRDFMYEAINQLPGCKCRKPDGAFYMFVDIRGTGMTAEAFCTRMLEEYYVTMTPGPIFGKNGEGFVRISYANSIENLKIAVERMKKALAN